MRPDFGAQDLALVVDVLVTWIGAATLGRYTLALGRHPAPSTLESRARVLMATFAALALLRGFSWLRPASTLLAFATFLPIAMLPIAMALFVEGLMRRHAPRWTKSLAAVATLAGLAADSVRLFDSSEQAVARIDSVFLVAQVVTIPALALLLVHADRASLSRSENALIRLCGIVALLAVPLALTDFRFELGWPIVRMGTLGPLLLCYTLLRRPDENVRARLWFRDVGQLLARALLISVFVAIALQTTNGLVLVPLAVLTVALLLAMAVWERLHEVESRTGALPLLRWLSHQLPSSREEFAAQLRHLPLTADALVLDGAALTQYDHQAIARVFAPAKVVYSLARLRALREGQGAGARGADDLTDLLERRGATHVALLSAEPLALLAITVPDLASRDVALALAAIVRRWPRLVIDAHARGE